MKKFNTNSILVLLIIVSLVTIVGCTRHFIIQPQNKACDFTVVEKFGKLHYVTVNDTRSELDRKGQSPSACGGGTPGVTVLGDENYHPKLLLPEIDTNLKTSIHETNLFSDISYDSTASESEYLIRTNLDQFYVVLNETKAEQTQACIGGVIGAAIAASIDVEATTDIKITGYLYQGNTEVWRKTVSKHIVKIDDYAKTKQNAEAAMGEAIGEASKELITEVAKYLASK